MGLVGSLALLAALAYAGACIWIRTQEAHLVYPRSRPYAPPSPSLALHEERIEFGDPEGSKLVAWIIPSLPGDDANVWLLFFHGNGDNVSVHGADYFDFRALGFNIMAPEYPGYLDAPGTPGETAIEREAQAAYDYLREVRKVPADHIALYGISLGSGVAIDLASKVEAGALIASAPFASLVAAAHELFPYLPMGLLLRNRYASDQKIGRVGMPVLVIHSDQDDFLPISAHGQRLFELAPEPKRFLRIHGAHGGDTTNAAINPEYFAAIEGFLSTVAGFRLRVPLPSVAPVIATAIERDGLEPALARYRSLRAEPEPRYGFQESELRELGIALLEQGKNEAAITILRLNAGEYPQSYEAYEAVADACAAAGKGDEALDNYRRALELFPGEGGYLREEIERLGGAPR